MRHHLLIPTVLLALVLGGCSRLPQPASTYDPALAKRALVESLQAWKEGKTASLSERMPPIRFVDDDLLAGRQLDDYRLNDPEAAVRPHQGVVVELFVQKKGGSLVRKRAEYQVSLWPSISVLRADP